MQRNRQPENEEKIAKGAARALRDELLRHAKAIDRASQQHAAGFKIDNAFALQIAEGLTFEGVFESAAIDHRRGFGASGQAGGVAHLVAAGAGHQVQIDAAQADSGYLPV